MAALSRFRVVISVTKMSNSIFKKLLMATLLPLNIFMVAVFSWKTGFKAYILIIAITTLGWLTFIIMVAKNGYMLGRRIIIDRERNPMKFYVNMALLLLGYVLMLLFAVGLYLQEIGYLAGN